MAFAAVASTTDGPPRSGELYKEGSKGKDVRTSNIVAAKAVANAVRTSLGPRGMDKLVVQKDGSVLVSNDGACLLSKMNVIHPAAKMLVQLSAAQDVEAGDGTTTVVVLAGALLEAAQSVLGAGMIHPTQIASGFLKAADYACEILEKAAVPVNLKDRDALLSAVETCLSSKVVAQNSDVMAPIAVDSVLGLLDDDDDDDDTNDDGDRPSTSKTKRSVDLRDIRVVHQVGGTVDDTELVRGLVLPKGASKAATGSPVSVPNGAKILLVQYCLSAPKTDMDNQVIVSDYAAMDRILREERKYILNQCKKIKKTGCNVLLIQKSILRDAYNELSLHFLAKMNILVVTDIERGDVDFICRTVGCTPVAHQDQLSPDKLGRCDTVADVFLEGASSRVVKFTGLHSSNDDDENKEGKSKRNNKTMTVLLRGSNEIVLEEAARSLHDAQCVVRCLVKQRALIAGGGAAETNASVQLQQYATTATTTTMSAAADESGDTSSAPNDKDAASGKDAFCFAAFADALEVIPYTLAENAGMRAVDVVTELRAKHAAGETSHGINVKKRAVTDVVKERVVQPLLVSTSAIRLAAETVAMIMKVDDLIVVK